MIEREKSLSSLFIEGIDGNQNSYRKFLEILLTTLRGVIARRLARFSSLAIDVDDIVQETLIAIHNKRHTYDRVTPVTAWASAIARYKMIDAVRTRYADRSKISLTELDNIASEESLDIDMQLSIRSALAALPQKMKDSIELVKVQGNSVKDAASVIGISEPAVKTSIHRGLKYMLRELK